jgi:hypothetical protein
MKPRWQSIHREEKNDKGGKASARDPTAKHPQELSDYGGKASAKSKRQWRQSIRQRPCGKASARGERLRWQSIRPDTTVATPNIGICISCTVLDTICSMCGEDAIIDFICTWLGTYHHVCITSIVHQVSSCVAPVATFSLLQTFLCEWLRVFSSSHWA